MTISFKIQFNLLGLLLLVIELLFPSFGLFSLSGLLSFIIGSFLLFKTGLWAAGASLYLIIAMTILTGLVFFVVFSLLLSSRRRPIVSGHEALLGAEGTVDFQGETVWVRILGERWQCSSEDKLHTGDPVRVIKRDGLILVVELVKK